jgi:DNA-binding IclR family transcriptional regulator
LPEGTSFPVTYGPSGHVYLAHCSREVRREMIEAAESSPTTNRLGAGVAPSDDELDRILADGYGLRVPPDLSEGVLAVPVYFGGAYVGGIHMRFMKRVLSRATVISRYLPRLQQAARDIESHLATQISETPALYNGIDSPLLVADVPSAAVPPKGATSPAALVT